MSDEIDLLKYLLNNLKMQQTLLYKVIKKKEVKDETKNRIRVISWILFVIYIGLLIYFLFLSEEYGRTSFDQRMYRYNLTPFQEIKRFWIYRHRVGFWVSFLNLAGNVIGFLPFGFFLPILSRRLRNSMRCVINDSVGVPICVNPAP